MQVVQQVLRNIMNQASQAESDETLDWGSQGTPPSKAVKMASTVVATVPILCVYPFIQKFFTQGVMVGAVKG
jgi:putative aldouronate transport system permease protein